MYKSTVTGLDSATPLVKIIDNKPIQFDLLVEIHGHIAALFFNFIHDIRFVHHVPMPVENIKFILYKIIKKENYRNDMISFR